MNYHNFKSFFRLIFLFVIMTIQSACSEAQVADKKGENSFLIKEIASGLEFPWGMTFLPNGDILVTEREGRLRLIQNGRLLPRPIEGLPENIYVAGQGGLLDVAIHPNFEENKLVYISYAGQGDGGAGTEVTRGVLKNNRLENVEVIFAVEPKTSGALHYGSRLVFAEDGTLFITVGDRYHKMEEAQNLANHLGSIMRINDDGSVPEDNPFVGVEGAQPEIYSYGHRNVQGITKRPSDHSIWSHEHGPKGGDEVNKLKPSANYGWPEITYGIDYSGEIISEETHKEGMEQPVIYWDPSIAPSGMDFYDGDKFPEWQGDLFVGALVKTHLRRLEMDGDNITEQEVLLDGLARIRDVKSGPDGYLYILTDDLNGKVLRLEPK